MASKVTRIRVFVASPGDVQAERNKLAKVIDEINLTINVIAPERAMFLELVRWETHVHPGLGDDAQDVVNKQIGDYDIFIGIIWKRLGTPTKRALSGTREEFQHAYELWKKNRSLPVLFYFCQEALPLPQTTEEVQQLRKVVEFRNELSTKGLVADYADHDSFADTVRPQLLLVLGQISLRNSDSKDYNSQNISQADTTATYQQMLLLARQYDDIRDTMKSGSERTRHMELVASKMRTLALQAYPLLEDFATNISPGLRLAAVSILRTRPHPDYLKWLGKRLSEEAPFIGYHAANALLTAVRTLKSTHLNELKVVIEKAKASLLDNHGPEAKQTDRYAVLNEALSELGAKEEKVN